MHVVYKPALLRINHPKVTQPMSGPDAFLQRTRLEL